MAKGKDRYLTRSELHQLISAARCPRDRVLLLLLLHTGARVSEAVQVRACDLLVEDCAVRLRNLKRRGGRVEEKLCAVPHEVMQDLVAYCQANGLSGTDYLLPGRQTRSHLTARQARNVVYDCARRAQVWRPRLRANALGPAWPHLLRHSLATHWVRGGVDVSIVARQLGHSDIRSTLEYVALSLADQQRASESVAL